MFSIFLRAVLSSCLILYCLSNAQAALSSASVKEVIGTAPYYKAVTVDLDPVDGKVASWDHQGMGASSLAPGDLIRSSYMLMDDDGDVGIDKPYGKRAIDGKIVGSYFILIDPKTGLYRDIKDQELELDTSKPGFPDADYFVQIPYTWVGAQIGLEFTPMTKYGIPNIGTTTKIDDPYKSDIVYIMSNNNPAIKDSIVRLNSKVKVGIWDAADITKVETHSSTGKQQTIPTDPTPYSFPGITNSPQLGHTYKALIWENTTNNGKLGGFATQDYIVDQIGTKTFYTWKLVKGNQPANGTISADTVITLVEKSADNSITLPATNAEALQKWPNAGLPKDEAALQGFTLQVDVDWEFNLNDAPPAKTRQAIPIGATPLK